MVPSLVLLLFAGLRPSELEDLTIKDVKKDRIRVSGGKLRRQLNRSVPIPYPTTMVRCLPLQR